MNHTALIAGAGLSKVAGLPTTAQLTKEFLTLGPTNATSAALQLAISHELRAYWERVFGYTDGKLPPSFEDHFTTLDLSANTGHHLGTNYSPKQLRAIRRLSIHRVFDILDSRVEENAALATFLAKLAAGQENSVVTTNWDIVIESRLGDLPFHYSIPMYWSGGEPVERLGLPILKLHGSANWAYCDCCGRLFRFRPSTGKDALNRHIFIDKEDFRALNSKESAKGWSISPDRKVKCFDCGVRLSSRVATFSYAKTLDFVHFVATWENAFRTLQEARHWIFIGYSFPEADFQLRHLLKMAQLGRGNDSSASITVVLADDEPAMQRFERFFGKSLTTTSTAGFVEWFQKCGLAEQMGTELGTPSSQ